MAGEAAPTVEVGTVTKTPSGALVLSGKASHDPGASSGGPGGSQAVAGLLAWAKAHPVEAALLAGAVYLVCSGRAGRRGEGWS